MNLYDDLPPTATASATGQGDAKVKGWAGLASAAPDTSSSRKPTKESNEEAQAPIATTATSAAPAAPPVWAGNKFLSDAVRRKNLAKASSGGTGTGGPQPVQRTSANTVQQQQAPTIVTIAQPNVLQAVALETRNVVPRNIGPPVAAPLAWAGGKGRGRRDPMDEEYDPAKPNAYDDIKAERRHRRSEKKEKLLREAMSRFGRKSPDSANQNNQFDDDDAEMHGHHRGGWSPQDNDEGGEEERQNRATSEHVERRREALAPGPKAPVVSLPGEDLSGEDAFLRRGQISFQQQSAAQTQQQPKPPAVSAPSRVICLLNLVDPGDVDDSFETEVSEECAKYGQVLKVLIFETPKAPKDSAVRVFVQFDSPESAKRGNVRNTSFWPLAVRLYFAHTPSCDNLAHTVMDGRFFGGRSIAARFFDEARFNRFGMSLTAGRFSFSPNSSNFPHRFLFSMYRRKRSCSKSQ